MRIFRIICLVLVQVMLAVNYINAAGLRTHLSPAVNIDNEVIIGTFIKARNISFEWMGVIDFWK